MQMDLWKKSKHRNTQQLFETEQRKGLTHTWGQHTTSLFRDIHNCYHVRLQRSATNRIPWFWVARQSNHTCWQRPTQELFAVIKSNLDQSGLSDTSLHLCYGLIRVARAAIKAVSWKCLCAWTWAIGSMKFKLFNVTGKRKNSPSGLLLWSAEVVTFVLKLCSISQSWACWSSTATFTASCFLLIRFLQSCSPLFFSRATLMKDQNMRGLREQLFAQSWYL